MNHDIVINYQNIRIRPLESKDLEKLRTWRNDNSKTRYLSPIPYITEEMQKNWFERIKNDDTEFVFAIEETIELKRFVGSFSVYNFEQNRAEFGKILVGDDEAHGRKIAYNCLLAIMDYCSETYLVDEMILYVYKENIAALTVYKKAGFCVMDEYDTVNGKELFMTKRIGRKKDNDEYKQ